MMMVGAGVFTVMAAVEVKGSITAYLQPFASGEYLAALIYLGVFCSVVSFFLSCYSLSRSI